MGLVPALPFARETARVSGCQNNCFGGYQPKKSLPCMDRESHDGRCAPSSSSVVIFPINVGPLLGETEAFSLLLQTPACSPKIVTVQQQCKDTVKYSNPPPGCMAMPRRQKCHPPLLATGQSLTLKSSLESLQLRRDFLLLGGERGRSSPSACPVLQHGLGGAVTPPLSSCARGPCLPHCVCEQSGGSKRRHSGERVSLCKESTVPPGSPSMWCSQFPLLPAGCLGWERCCPVMVQQGPGESNHPRGTAGSVHIGKI